MYFPSNINETYLSLRCFDIIVSHHARHLCRAPYFYNRQIDHDHNRHIKLLHLIFYYIIPSFHWTTTWFLTRNMINWA